MHNAFLIIAGLTLVLALALVLWPLLARPGQGTLATRAEQLRGKLALLKQAHAEGLLDETEFESRRKALSDELMELMDRPVTGRSRAARITAGLLAALLPPAALLGYLSVGEPRALSFSAAARPPAQPGISGADTQAPELAAAADSLRERLQNSPEDIEGWLLLARTYRELARFADARDAYARVREARPQDLDIMVEYAESLGLAGNPRTLLGEPAALLQQVLQIEPDHQRALWLMGFAHTQDGDYAAALGLWERLLAMMEDPDARNALLGQVNQARGRLGMDPLPLETPPSPPASAASAGGDVDVADARGVAVPINTSATPAPPASASPAPTDTAAPSSGIEVRLQLDPALASKVAPGDTLFVFAKAEGGPPMPLAVQRLPASVLPTTIRLDDSMGMVEGMTLSRFPRVVVEARISRSGNAQAQAGDVQGSSGGVDNPPASAITLTLDRVL